MITNGTNARKNLFRLMDTAIAGNEEIIITGKSGNVVMISEQDYRDMMETIGLCSVPGMREKLTQGAMLPLSECVEDAPDEW